MKLILRNAIFVSAFAFSFKAFAYPGKEKDIITVKKDPQQNKVEILANGQKFTEFIYPDSMEKPVLYPIYASDGELITRGFPIAPREHDPVDHPHHIGLWLNYENVNGLDFWNNSFAIPADKKNKYGWIKTNKIVEMKDGKTGVLTYAASWQNQQKEELLQEKTSFFFSAEGSLRIIDRITTLTASRDVSFPDVKDGMLGLRVAHELELPSKDNKEFIDNKGNVTTVKPSNDLVTGNYVTGNNKQGDSAWGTRSPWCMLYGKKGADTISIAIIDHPGNVGYPTYWHARGYGLFAANPLGQKVFSNGKEQLNYSLPKGQSVTFRYRVIINAGKDRLSVEEIKKLTDQFQSTYK